MADKCKEADGLREEPGKLGDADTEAFNPVLAGLQMPKGSEAEIAPRPRAIPGATKGAAPVALPGAAAA